MPAKSNMDWIPIFETEVTRAPPPPLLVVVVVVVVKK
jgi:hypothetical protein